MEAHLDVYYEDGICGGSGQGNTTFWPYKAYVRTVQIMILDFEKITRLSTGGFICVCVRVYVLLTGKTIMTIRLLRLKV